MVAIYNADVWCDECAEKIKRSVAKEIIIKLKPVLKEQFPRSDVGDIPSETHEDLVQALIEVCDKGMMDSDDWPSCGHPTEHTDSPQHCGADEACETAEVLSDGRKVGALLGTELTDHGVNYLNEMLGEFHESNVSLHEFWREQFDSYDLVPDPADEDEDEDEPDLPEVPADFEVKVLKDGEPAKDRMTCGTCGRSWDDGISTSYTPVPSARCPFEYYHKAEGEE